MRKRLATMVGLCALAAAIAPKPAAAAVEFGDGCAANDASGVPINYFAMTSTRDPMSLTAPTGGVITKWKSMLAMPESFPQSLKVLRPQGGNTVQIVGEASGVLVNGLNAFDTRLPVQQGDRLGLYGSGAGGTVFCNYPDPENEEEKDIFGGFLGGSTGQTVAFSVIRDAAGIPVSAVIEPDADNDGHGDETQDKCPQSAATQGTCPAVAVPPIVLDAFSQAGKRAVTVYVATSAGAQVTVSGSVRLGKGKAVTLKAGPATASPGQFGKFALRFPFKLVKRLKELAPNRNLTLNVTASAANAGGVVSTDSTSAKLKGQASG